MTDREVVDFVRTHKGEWSSALFGYAYWFDAPGFTRPPFQARRLNRLIREGLVERVGDGKPNVYKGALRAR
jgi:hypothetical protein